MVRFCTHLLKSLLFLMVVTGCSSNTTPEKETPARETKSTLTKDETEITCPKCGFTKKEIMPTDVCQIKYNCTNCQAELFPKDGDCCVYCTYGTHKCPSKQE